MENDICLFGASGHCKVIIDILESNNVSVDFIVDDNPKTNELLSIPVIHSNELSDLRNKKMIVSIGNNSIRKKIVANLKTQFFKTIHNRAIVSGYSTIQEGTVVMAGAIINASVKIGSHCIINTGAVIEHDCQINNFVHISPNASLAGGVEIGEGAHIGIGASIIQGIKIGKWAIVGAGTVVIKDVPDYAVVVGNPGKIIKYLNKEI
ncbi:acetyltransferase [Flavobacterium sp. PLA-1-15]|uniref:acetyltransferase n=1 Tax=Flavobacterium sp. PLA-1-15 TaxID=3380533 RepID=UPI003B769305